LKSLAVTRFAVILLVMFMGADFLRGANPL